VGAVVQGAERETLQRWIDVEDEELDALYTLRVEAPKPVPTPLHLWVIASGRCVCDLSLLSTHLYVS
jgi:hypothetical protein